MLNLVILVTTGLNFETIPFHPSQVGKLREKIVNLD